MNRQPGPRGMSGSYRGSCGVWVDDGVRLVELRSVPTRTKRLGFVGRSLPRAVSSYHLIPPHPIGFVSFLLADMRSRRHSLIALMRSLHTLLGTAGATVLRVPRRLKIWQHQRHYRVIYTALSKGQEASVSSHHEQPGNTPIEEEKPKRVDPSRRNEPAGLFRRAIREGPYPARWRRGNLRDGEHRVLLHSRQGEKGSPHEDVRGALVDFPAHVGIRRANHDRVAVDRDRAAEAVVGLTW